MGPWQQIILKRWEIPPDGGQPFLVEFTCPWARFLACINDADGEAKALSPIAVSAAAPELAELHAVRSLSTDAATKFAATCAEACRRVNAGAHSPDPQLTKEAKARLAGP